jgi:hypothetical protein
MPGKANEKSTAKENRGIGSYTEKTDLAQEFLRKERWKRDVT